MALLAPTADRLLERPRIPFRPELPEDVVPQAVAGLVGPVPLSEEARALAVDRANARHHFGVEPAALMKAASRLPCGSAGLIDGLIGIWSAHQVRERCNLAPCPAQLPPTLARGPT
jgi:hypothetical protein